MNAPETLQGLSQQEKRVLLALRTAPAAVEAEQIFSSGGFGQLVEVMNAASWLQSKGLIKIEEKASKLYSLRERSILSTGLPERRALTALSAAGGKLPLSELDVQLGKEISGLAIGWLKRKGLATIEKGPAGPLV